MPRTWRPFVRRRPQLQVVVSPEPRDGADPTSQRVLDAVATDLLREFAYAAADEYFDAVIAGKWSPPK